MDNTSSIHYTGHDVGRATCATGRDSSQQHHGSRHGIPPTLLCPTSGSSIRLSSPPTAHSSPPSSSGGRLAQLLFSRGDLGLGRSPALRPPRLLPFSSRAPTSSLVGSIGSRHGIPSTLLRTPTSNLLSSNASRHGIPSTLLCPTNGSSIRLFSTPPARGSPLGSSGGRLAQLLISRGDPGLGRSPALRPLRLLLFPSSTPASKRGRRHRAVTLNFMAPGEPHQTSYIWLPPSRTGPPHRSIEKERTVARSDCLPAPRLREPRWQDSFSAQAAHEFAPRRLFVYRRRRGEQTYVRLQDPHLPGR